MTGAMSRTRLLLLVGSIIATTLMLAAIAAGWAGTSLIDQRTFNALMGASIGLWICYAVATCTGIVVRLMIAQEADRAARVSEMMETNGLAHLDRRRNGHASVN